MHDTASAAAHGVQHVAAGTMVTTVDLELDELRREFLAEAQQKVREIESALARGKDAATLQRLAYLAHQLKGSGGSYGYERISTEAAALEKAVEEEAPHDGDLRKYVTSLRTEIDDRASELG